MTARLPERFSFKEYPAMPFSADIEPQVHTRFLSGISALVELPILQRRNDLSRGLSTAGLISGYRGSPLGTYDQQLWKARDRLKVAGIEFQPGLNEDLAATALWGAQMHKAFGETRVDGVFGIWYGKGPGVDRSGDVFRNANILGTSKLGGVLAIGGDDHAAQSSMFPHQTDGIFQSVMMPVLQPSSVQEIIELGLAGIELSRYCGSWVAFKTIAEIVESSTTVSISDETRIWKTPERPLPRHGLNWDPAIRWPEERYELERRQLEERLPAAIDWIRANRINTPVLKPAATRLVLATCGKAHQDTLQALSDLGLDRQALELLGIGIYKFGCSWPVSASDVLEGFPGAEEILVIEEKAPTIEDQLKAGLYGRQNAPRITGKFDPDGNRLLRQTLEFTPIDIARAVTRRVEALSDFSSTDVWQSALRRLGQLEKMSAPLALGSIAARKPYFCSGCPHNTSTKTPDGSISGGGIGCHVMALSMPSRKTQTFSQMGGEGVQWMGASLFSRTPHIFQNLGDGTYEHSGLLAIRAAVAARTRITYKILFNDAVAMTGGQPLEHETSPLNIVRQLRAEKVSEVVFVSDDPARWRKQLQAQPGIRVHHRDELDAIQQRLRDIEGVTAIVYEQTCAAEKRRRRKRGNYPDPPKRIFINPRVCEGCGDCSVQSNCIAVEPIKTPLGPKRAVNQSSCNKDFSCTKGFCPSFVELDSPVIRKPDKTRIAEAEAAILKRVPEPEIPALADVRNIYVTGIGGLGVLTLGALLGKAAELDGLSSTVLDFTGLAQKNGAVVSHVRLAPVTRQIHAVRIPDGMVDVLLAADALVAASTGNLQKLSVRRSAAVINTDEAPTADNVQDVQFELPTGEAIRRISNAVSRDATFEVSLTSLADRIFGNTIASNIMLLGYAWQKGLIPINRVSLIEAIKINGAAVAMNLRAFEWGRAIAKDPGAVEILISNDDPEDIARPWTKTRFAEELADYQDQAYADRYADIVGRVALACKAFGADGGEIVRSVEQNAYKVMAYKDEYEVARLYASADYRRALEKQFSDWKSVRVWLAPPSLNPFSKKGAPPRKRRFGPWVFAAFALLRSLKRLRGTAFDPFGLTAERRGERALRDDYLDMVLDITQRLTPANLNLAKELVALPADVRGYGHVKERSVEQVRARWQSLRREFDRTSKSTDVITDPVRG